MESKKATTLAQRFGFQDPELKTQKHDELMIWLDGAVADLIGRIDGIREYESKLDSLVQQYGDYRAYGNHFDEKPIPDDMKMVVDAYPLGVTIRRVTEKTWEKPVMNGNFMVGFVDMLVVYAVERDNVRLSPRWTGQKYGITSHSEGAQFKFAFEVKPSIPSAGELIRQIRMYQPFTHGVRWFIVSPDTRFRSVIEGQGIGFINPSEFEQGSLFT